MAHRAKRPGGTQGAWLGACSIQSKTLAACTCVSAPAAGRLPCLPRLRTSYACSTLCQIACNNIGLQDFGDDSRKQPHQHVARCTAAALLGANTFLRSAGRRLYECMAGLLVTMTLQQCCACPIPGIHPPDTPCTACAEVQLAQQTLKSCSPRSKVSSMAPFL